MMKRAFSLILLGAIFALSACSFENIAFTVPEDEVLASLPDYETRRFYSSGGFQDYTDYAVYTFAEIDEEDLLHNDYFCLITDNNDEFFSGFMDNYESWIQVYRDSEPDSELVENYDFDRNIMNRGDYICIIGDDEEQRNEDIDTYGMYYDYDIYFYDVESKILYYFHNNI